MKSIDDAISLYTYAMSNPLSIRNHLIEVKYSIHPHLQRNPLDYTVSHIILVTICGCEKSPLSLLDMANVGDVRGAHE